MATLTTPQILTPADDGRVIDPEEFERSIGEEGHRYEIIDGRISVSPLPDAPNDDLESWLHAKLQEYSAQRPDLIHYVTRKARIFISNRPRATRPEPDIAAYQNYPHHLPRRERRWQDLTPALVVEVLSEENAEKDLVRNVALYLEVPSIKEYWILDPRLDPDQPSLLVYRRRGKNWQKPIAVPYGETYETPRFLPGFRLVVNPDK